MTEREIFWGKSCFRGFCYLFCDWDDSRSSMARHDICCVALYYLVCGWIHMNKWWLTVGRAGVAEEAHLSASYLLLCPDGHFFLAFLQQNMRIHNITTCHYSWPQQQRHCWKIFRMHFFPINFVSKKWYVLLVTVTFSKIMCPLARLPPIRVCM